MARSTGTCVLWKGGYGFIEVDAEGEGADWCGCPR